MENIIAQLQNDQMAWLIVMCFIVIDFVSGLVKALKNGTYSSTVAREGLFHKVGYILVMVLTELVTISGVYLDLGVLSSGLVMTGVAAWICLTEAGSVIENACEISPDIAGSFIGGLLNSTKGTDNNGSNSTNTD